MKPVVLLQLLAVFLNVFICKSCAPTTSNQRQSASTNILGPDIQIKKPIKSAGSGLISKQEDLRCFDFENSCRWRNAYTKSSNSLQWFEAKGGPDNAMLRLATGSDQVPRSSYAMTSSSKLLQPELESVLISDPIPCVSGDAELRLKFWASPAVVLLICAKRLSREPEDYDFCSPKMSNGSSGAAIFQIPGPIPEPFEVFIRARNFAFASQEIMGGFVMVDDIEFLARLCPWVSDQCQLQRKYCNINTCSNPSVVGGTGFLLWCQQCDLCFEFAQSVRKQPKPRTAFTTVLPVTKPKEPKTTPGDPFIGRRRTPANLCPAGFEQWHQGGNRTRRFKAKTTDLCYRSLDLEETWPAASIACKTIGAHLPSFRNKQEASQFTAYARLKGIMRSWIGLRDQDRNGSPSGEFWDDNVPYVDGNEVGWREEAVFLGGCAGLDAWHQQWSWLSCHQQKMPVVCQMRAHQQLQS